MSVPNIGDALIRNLPTQCYEVVDAVTRRHLAGPFSGLSEAVLAARGFGGVLWHQVTDGRGRPVTDPGRFPDEL